MAVAPVTVPLAVLPLFVAAGLMYADDSGVARVFALVAPALFYSGYAIAAIRGAEARLQLREEQLEAQVRRRVDEFSPSEVSVSRRYFETRLGQEIKRSKRHQLPLCVLTLATRPGGERGIHTTQLVELAARSLRAEDCAGRLGRHLYAIYLPHTTPAGAEVVIERLRHEFEDKELIFGLAYLEPGQDATPALLLRAATESAAAA